MSSPGGHEELAHDVLRHLLGVMQAMKEHVTALATEFDLTLSQLDAMKNLGEPCSQRELAQCLHFDASNVTDIVDRLEARGLVSRTIDPTDRRVRRLVLTPEGEAVRRKLFERAVDEAPISSLTPAEQAQLSQLLAKIAAPVDLPF
jgi:MarR family transcriptional regulator, organic hydroperoxide resistance regulator